MTNEEKLLFDALHESRVTANKVVFQQRAFRGIRQSVVDKYSDTGHFVYELLQNADDAFATEVTIVLKEDRLLFKHNGTKHFDITPESDNQHIGDINSITGIGDSSKHELYNKIGKFGVGFKAVFQYTDTPEIYDDTFKFKIEDLIIPTLIDDDYPGRNEGETLFVLPFHDPNKSFKDIKQRLENLNNPILFLHNLKKIVWSIDSKIPSLNHSVEYSKKLQFKQTFDNITLEKYTLNNASREDSIFLFSQKVAIDYNGEKTVLPICIGFFYDEVKQALITNNRQNIYCFFPTKESFKGCFIAHAPFLLIENRQNIKRDESLNKDLIKLLAELATRSVLLLRDYGIKHNRLLINENIIDIVPRYKNSYFYNENGFIETPMSNAFEELLASDEEPIFLSRNNVYLTADEVYTTINAINELLTKEQFLSLRLSSPYKEETDNVNIDFLKWELITRLDKIYDNAIFDEVCIKDYTVQNLASDISERFMQKQKFEWVTKFYTFLRNDAPKYWKISPQTKDTAQYFRHAPIIKIQNGHWVPPFTNITTPNVFLPLVKEQTSQTEYNFIDKDYLKDDMAVKFFDELEIKQPDEYDYIRNHILSKYRSTINFFSKVDEISDTLKSDFEILINYYQTVKGTPKEDNYIELIKKNILLKGTDGNIYPPSVLYIKDNYLKLYFGDRITFFDFAFYSNPNNDYKSSFIYDFIISAGVCTKPSLKQQTYYDKDKMPNHLRRELSSIDYYEFQKINDWILDGFQEADKYSFINKQLSVHLWNEWISYDDNSLQATISTRRKRHQYYDLTYVDSTFIHHLKHYEWVYNKKGEIIAPEDVYLEDLAPEYNLYNGLPELLCIKKRTQNLKDKYGLTNDEQNTYEFGSRLKQAAGDELTEEEILQLIEEKKRQKRTQKAANSLKHTTPEEKNNADILPPIQNEDKESIEDKLDKRWEEKKNRFVNKPHTSSNSGDDIPLDIPSPGNTTPSNDGPFFSPSYTSPNSDDKDVDETARAEQNLKKKDTQAQTEAENAKEQVEILDLLKNTPTYTFKWYKVLMELMHAGQRSINERRTQIDFSKFCTLCSDKILELTEPSIPVPSWLIDAEKYSITAISGGKSVKIEGIIIKTENDSIDLSVELDDKLQRELKDAKKIRVVAVDNTNIIDSLETRFLQLEKEDDFNMNDNLPSNLEFIYGPPGTGKTTELVKQVHDILVSEPHSKILVLTPTNKAADVVAIKMSDDETCYNGLSRYGATESLYLIEDIGCLTNRDTTDMDSFYNIVVATAARYAYDYLQPNDTPICEYPWDYIFVDEASMVDILTMTFIIYQGSSAKKIIISGDPKQIQPVVQNDMPAYNIYMTW